DGREADVHAGEEDPGLRADVRAGDGGGRGRGAPRRPPRQVRRQGGGGRQVGGSVNVAVALIVAAGSGERLGASRPKAFVTLAAVGATLAALYGADAAIAAAPVADTIKEADADGTVRATLDRSRLWAVQTPQTFRRDALRRALDVDDDTLAAATDDAWLV